jgi:hypothetical protein
MFVALLMDQVSVNPLEELSGLAVKLSIAGFWTVGLVVADLLMSSD